MDNRKYYTEKQNKTIREKLRKFKTFFYLTAGYFIIRLIVLILEYANIYTVNFYIKIGISILYLLISIYYIMLLKK